MFPQSTYLCLRLSLVAMSPTYTLEAPMNLIRIPDLDTKRVCELPDQARILLERASDEDNVRLALVQDTLRDMRVVDHPDRADDEVRRCLLGCGCKRSLVGRPSHSPLRWMVTASRYVKEVDTMRLEYWRKAGRVFGAPGRFVRERRLEILASRNAQE